MYKLSGNSDVHPDVFEDVRTGHMRRPQCQSSSAAETPRPGFVSSTSPCVPLVRTFGATKEGFQ